MLRFRLVLEDESVVYYQYEPSKDYIGWGSVQANGYLYLRIWYSYRELYFRISKEKGLNKIEKSTLAEYRFLKIFTDKEIESKTLKDEDAIVF